MLNANLGAPQRFGGDQIGGEGLTVVPTKSVALFTGTLTVSANGTVTAPIEIPDFNGELRLMAVAWSADRLGSASAPLTVRDPVPAELSLPRFLSPGDAATATLLIDNVDGVAGDYEVILSGDGPVDMAQSETIALGVGEQATRTFFSGDARNWDWRGDYAGCGPWRLRRGALLPNSIENSIFPGDANTYRAACARRTIFADQRCRSALYAGLC